MRQSKIDTIRKNLEETYDAMNKEVERLEEYADDMYYTIRSIEDRIFDMEHCYFEDEQLTFAEQCKLYNKTLEEFEDAKSLRDIILDELRAMRAARRAVEKALDAMEDA